MFIGLVLVIASVAIYFLMPTPQQQEPKKPTKSDVESPTAEVGETIPVIFGTVLVKKTVVLWWGDFKTKAIRTKGKKG